VTIKTIGIGGPNDQIIITLGGVDVKLTESYEVKISILQQPSAFTLRLGDHNTAADILQLAEPGTDFQLKVGTGDGVRIIQAGRIDSRAVLSSSTTQVEIKGRDWMAHLFDSFVEQEQDFPQKNFYDLTRAVMDKAGLLKDIGYDLKVLNDDNRKLMTGARPMFHGSTELAHELNTGALSGTGELVYKTLKAKLGTRYYDFLQQQYKLAGLFLWASPDKSFVLARPRSTQEPSFFIRRDRRGETNVIDCSFRDDTTMRHGLVTVFGKSGGGKRGVEICRGAEVDPEMINHHLVKTLVVHDPDAKTKEECEYVARRIISEARRAGWQLEYTLAGHQAPCVSSDSGFAVWGPDMVVNVKDMEFHVDGDDSLNFKRDFYIEAVTYSRNPQTQTKITLMRPGDLLFATGLQDDDQIIKRKSTPLKGATLKSVLK
jgi:prophage tail gpP-like protein